jgi:hypothetical protein
LDLRQGSALKLSLKQLPNDFQSIPPLLTLLFLSRSDHSASSGRASQRYRFLQFLFGSDHSASSGQASQPYSALQWH